MASKVEGPTINVTPDGGVVKKIIKEGKGAVPKAGSIVGGMCQQRSNN
jgi:hypothetical protein